MSTIKRRITDMEHQARHHQLRKNPPPVMTYEQTRAQAMQQDGWDLSVLPGDTLDEQEQSADLCAQGKLEVTPEARHAARFWIALYDL